MFWFARREKVSRTTSTSRNGRPRRPSNTWSRCRGRSPACASAATSSSWSAPTVFHWRTLRHRSSSTRPERERVRKCPSLAVRSTRARSQRGSGTRRRRARPTVASRLRGTTPRSSTPPCSIQPGKARRRCPSTAPSPTVRFSPAARPNRSSCSASSTTTARSIRPCSSTSIRARGAWVLRPSWLEKKDPASRTTTTTPMMERRFSCPAVTRWEPTASRR